MSIHRIDEPLSSQKKSHRLDVMLLSALRQALKFGVMRLDINPSPCLNREQAECRDKANNQKEVG